MGDNLADPDLEEAAIRFANGDDAGAEGGLVELEVGEAPEQAASGPAARLDIPFGVPVLLLEMLGPQEQPLRPHDFAVPGHGGFRDQVDGRPSGAAFRGTGGRC